MMQNVFKCQNCGTENRVGEVFCRQCRIKFQYTCPRCQSGVTGGESSCHRCGHSLNWPIQSTMTAPDKEKHTEERAPGSPRSWLLPLAGLILVLATAGVGVYWVKSIMDEPQRPAVTDNLSSTVKDGVFIPDVSAPKISNIGLKNINYNTVEITWVTDEPSNSQLIWHIKDGTPQSSELKEALVTNHQIELTNLKNKSTYYYKARSVDQAGNLAIYDEKTFDIGIQRSVPKVEVAWSAIKTVEQQPSVFKTIINGEIKNTGESTISIKEIEVTVTISVSGKQGVSVVQASLDPYPLEIYPQAVHKYTAEVPNRTGPVYKVEARIIEE